MASEQNNLDNINIKVTPVGGQGEGGKLSPRFGGKEVH